VPLPPPTSLPFPIRVPLPYPSTRTPLAPTPTCPRWKNDPDGLWDPDDPRDRLDDDDDGRGAGHGRAGGFDQSDTDKLFDQLLGGDDGDEDGGEEEDDDGGFGALPPPTPLPFPVRVPLLYPSSIRRPAPKTSQGDDTRCGD